MLPYRTHVISGSATVAYEHAFINSHHPWNTYTAEHMPPPRKTTRKISTPTFIPTKFSYFLHSEDCPTFLCNHFPVLKTSRSRTCIIDRPYIHPTVTHHYAVRPISTDYSSCIFLQKYIILHLPKKASLSFRIFTIIIRDDVTSSDDRGTHTITGQPYSPAVDHTDTPAAYGQIFQWCPGCVPEHMHAENASELSASTPENTQHFELTGVLITESSAYPRVTEAHSRGYLGNDHPVPVPHPSFTTFGVCRASSNPVSSRNIFNYR